MARGPITGLAGSGGINLVGSAMWLAAANLILQDGTIFDCGHVKHIPGSGGMTGKLLRQADETASERRYFKDATGFIEGFSSSQ